MNLYIININITDSQAKYLLNNFTEYNGQPCDIIEIINRYDITFVHGYLDKLTIGKLKYQLTYKTISFCIKKDQEYIIDYLIQTL